MHSSVAQHDFPQRHLGVFCSCSLPFIDCKTPQEYLFAAVDENEV